MKSSTEIIVFNGDNIFELLQKALDALQELQDELTEDALDQLGPVGSVQLEAFSGAYSTNGASVTMTYTIFYEDSDGATGGATKWLN